MSPTRTINTPQEERFPIRDLNAKTQVNTVTLRAWERRYGLLKPQRTDKGHRLYSEEDVTTVNTILEYMARGVSIGKIKPLLADASLADIATNDTDQEASWQVLVEQTLHVIQEFSTIKLERHWHMLLTNYPLMVAQEHVLSPVFSALTQRNDQGAQLAFAESELVRYANLRMSSNAKHGKVKGTRKAKRKDRDTNKPEQAQSIDDTHCDQVFLTIGDKASLWVLACLAIAMSDANVGVTLVTAPCTPATIHALAQQLQPTTVIYYQDGSWKTAQQATMREALDQQQNLWLLGTAPMLLVRSKHQRVFADAVTCSQHFLHATAHRTT